LKHNGYVGYIIFVPSFFFWHEVVAKDAQIMHDMFLTLLLYRKGL
jgi:hypothetical protein